MKQSELRYFRIVKKTFKSGNKYYFIQYRYKGWKWIFGWTEKTEKNHYFQEAEMRIERAIESDKAEAEHKKIVKTEIVE